MSTTISKPSTCGTINKSITATVALAASIVTMGGAQRGSDDPQRSEPPTTTADFVVKLRAEAARLDNESASDIFAALADSETQNQLKLTGTQIDLISRLDQLVRDLEKAWLLRGLDGARLPTRARLEERVSERGRLLCAGLVTNAEGIALEGVLEPEQARLLRRQLRKLPPTPLASRYSGIRAPRTDDLTTPDWGWVHQQINSRVNTLSRPGVVLDSELFGIMLGYREQLGVPFRPSREEADSIGRIAEVLRLVQKDLYERSMGPDPMMTGRSRLPAPPSLANFFSEASQRRRASFVARAEALALDGALTPERAEEARRSLWSFLGVMALLDPEVGERLGITRLQRGRLIAQLRMWAIVADEAEGGVAAVRSERAFDRGELTDAQLLTLEKELVDNRQATVGAANRAVLSVLTRTQVRAFRELLRGPDEA